MDRLSSLLEHFKVAHAGWVQGEAVRACMEFKLGNIPIQLVSDVMCTLLESCVAVKGRRQACSLEHVQVGGPLTASMSGIARVTLSATSRSGGDDCRLLF